jgi:O-antigen ligase
MAIFKAGSTKIFIQTGGLTLTCCLLSVIIMPVYVYYLPPFMILWGLCWLFENISGIKKVFFPKNKAAILFFLFMSFLLWQIAGLLLAESLNSGIDRIFKRLSFLLFPLVLFYPGNRIIKNIQLMLRLFAICTFLYILYCFVNALHNSLIIQSGKWIFNPHPVEYDYENYFYNNRLSYLIHPSYLAMYVVLSILVSLENIFNYGMTRIRKALWFLVMVVFFTVLYLLSSRAGILALIIILPIYILFKFYNKFSKWIVLVAIAIFAIVFVEIAKTNKKIQSSIESISNKNINETLNNDERLLIWKSALGVIKENLVLGVGAGDASDKLKEEFKRRGYVNGFYDNLNAHNQFLEILLENGLIGLILFITVLGYMSYLAINQQNLLSGLFIIMMVIFFMFETVLNRLAGITFFPFFSFLLIHLKQTIDL